MSIVRIRVLSTCDPGKDRPPAMYTRSRAFFFSLVLLDSAACTEQVDSASIILCLIPFNLFQSRPLVEHLDHQWSLLKLALAYIGVINISN